MSGDTANSEITRAQLDAAVEPEIAADERLPSEMLIISIEGFEGPLDLLLALARTQKLDLAKLSILALAQQYLDFIAAARALRLEVAADYLVMAAWLAFLKSKLLLPVEEKSDDGPSGQELAAQLAFRLKRLEAMREAVARIMNRKQLGVDVFARGMPEGVRTVRTSEYFANVYDLLKAYASQRKRDAAQPVKLGGRTAWSIKEARVRLEKLLGECADVLEADWAVIDQFLTEFVLEPEVNRTVRASTFGAALELAREGYLEIRQAYAFGPLYMRWLNRPPEQSVGRLATPCPPDAAREAPHIAATG